MTLLRRAFGLNFTSLMWCAGFLLLSLMASYMVSADSDLVLHILYGRSILEQGLPVADPLLSGATAAPVLQEWLFEVMVAWLDSSFGLLGPLLVFALLMSALLAGLFRRMRSQGVCVWIALLYGIFILVTLRIHLVIRPHLLSWAAVPLLYVLLEDWRVGKHSLPFTLLSGSVLMLLWTNMHGGFLIGLALTSVYAAEAGLRAISHRELEKFLQAAVLLTVYCLVSLLNPWGWHLHQHLMAFLSNDLLISSTTDFMPPRFSNGTLWVLLFALGATLLPLLLRRRQVPARDWILLVGLTYAAATSLRNIPFLGVVMLPIAAVHLQGWLVGSQKGAARILLASSARLEEDEADSTGIGWSLLVSVGVVWLLVSGAIRVGLYSENVPVDALQWVNEQPQLHALPAFADYLFAGYLLYATPVQRVFLHALNANYPAARIETFFQIDRQDPGWEQEIADIDWAFIDANRNQVQAFRASPCWQERYGDESAVVFEKTCEAP